MTVGAVRIAANQSGFEWASFRHRFMDVCVLGPGVSCISAHPGARRPQAAVGAAKEGEGEVANDGHVPYAVAFARPHSALVQDDVQGPAGWFSMAQCFLDKVGRQFFGAAGGGDEGSGVFTISIL